MNKLELITQNLVHSITDLSSKADEIYILTSFVMKSGVKKILPVLKEAASRGAQIRVCTGDYLYITQPDALQLLVEEVPEAEVRLWQSGGKSFHPKAYLFRMPNSSHLIVGSSNMSASALSSGVEWNLHAPSSVDEQIFETAVEEFMNVFSHDYTISMNQESIKRYREGYEKFHENNSVAVQWSKSEEIDLMFSEPKDQAEIIHDERESYITKPDILEPRPAQKEALRALENTVEEEYERALVVMATGLGKTYLAAFFAQTFKRILFVVHREEILEQGKKSFLHVMPDRTAGLLNAKHKEKNADMIFASVFTIGIKHHLESFRKDDFDLIIVDEFHHAAASSYKNILEYFEPKFLLGITATPDRMDNKDVYSLCDGNMAYNIHFLEAIQKQWLSPFIYYGVYDDTDYSAISWLGTRYDQEELLQVQLKESMAEKILNAWEKHRQTRTIGFCSSIKQAEFLSEFFNRAGWKTVALHSRTKNITRPTAIKKLDQGELDIIFTVDLFNEGVDIPSVDTLLFARPTESLTVFTQQVGRGLRIAEGKSHCVIIDLIGNYRNADVKLQVFDTDPDRKGKSTNVIPTVPSNCQIDFDLEAIDLLKAMNRKKNPRKDQLLYAFEELKLELGRRPTYLEFHLNAKSDSKAIKDYYQSYPGLLFSVDEMSSEEDSVYEQYKDWFKEVESTGMTKSYKMIVLLYMLSKGPERWLEPITPLEAAPFFHSYLTSKEYRKRIDFSDKKGKQLAEYNEKKVAQLIAEMPMDKWSGTSNGLVSFDGNKFTIQLEVNEADKEILYDWTKQICEYRLHWHFERKEENLKKLQ
ncbi:superfamily II DNA or RNA helicase/HKD family nuclease [Bacillus ectoiniformans]|uniref:DEAD/DEAH box helicase family protein n=1 Tax=Bacillus ectoiniformans TaxID=1494429 RepID=UPI001957C1CA|nr:DEAD/DEAH box helicase family protein [Bacillus ectoiniformans]MBM7648650.1 superfamily II DNA or RNA helicase/HKD family nuclease [Bacillus ectoiniformans]